MSIIKICHITSAHNWNDIRIFVKECSSLAKHGFEVSLVAANCETQTVNNVKIVGVESIGKGRFFRMRKTSRAIYEKAKSLNADIYHFHDPELLPHGLRLKKAGKKVIYDAHEDLPRQILSKYWINKYLRKIASRVFERYENRIVRKLDFIVTATPHIRDRFLKINKNTIDINNFPLENELSIPTAWADKKAEVCYIGGITQIRGNDVLVDAMEHIDKVTMVMAGPFATEEYGNSLKQKAGWAKVNYQGIVDRNQVALIMSHAKAGMVTFLPLPNHIDAQPNKMFEYMSAGIPVIGSNFPLWKEIIEGNNCGICIDPTNPQDIAKAINSIIQSDSLAEQMGKNGREAVLKKYNWTVEESKLVELYNKVAHSSEN
jgi:glycosyltransferase involved in cell wall biosynthesis